MYSLIKLRYFRQQENDSKLMKNYTGVVISIYSPIYLWLVILFYHKQIFSRWRWNDLWSDAQMKLRVIHWSDLFVVQYQVRHLFVSLLHVCKPIGQSKCARLQYQWMSTLTYLRDSLKRKIIVCINQSKYFHSFTI